MALRVDEDLIITYSWGSNNHGICGHLFEVIEYFWILKDHFNVKILLAEIDKPTFEKALLSKYDFSKDELQFIFKRTIFEYKPKILICNNILFTDGGLNQLKGTVIKAEQKIMFSCSKYDIPKDWIVLEDHRVYGKRKSIHYVKKILFSRLKRINNAKNKTMIYMTKNCRSVGDEVLNEIDGDVLALVNEIPQNKLPHIEYKVVPVENIMEQFQTYVYTPVPRKWDCSNRFIAECLFYGKTVEYKNIDYLDVDTALNVRISDCKDLNLISLKEKDNIIGILKGLL